MNLRKEFVDIVKGLKSYWREIRPGEKRPGPSTDEWGFIKQTGSVSKWAESEFYGPGAIDAFECQQESLRQRGYPCDTRLTTNDLDPRTGKPYPDYMERRAARVAARRGGGYGRDLGSLHPGD